MKTINPADAPVQPTSRNNSAKWRFIEHALRDGQAVVIEAHEYTDEIKTRNSITVSLKRWGLAITIRKDSKTGDLYVFLKPEETGPVPLTSVVEEYEEAEQ
jgi:hypothetical protein